MIPCVNFIMALNPALRKLFKNSWCFPLIRVTEKPNTIDQKISASISPFTAAESGFVGIIRIIISPSELGFDRDSGSNEVDWEGKLRPTPGWIILVRVNPIRIARIDDKK